MRILIGRNQKLRLSMSINHYLDDYGLSASINYKNRGYSKSLSFVIQIWDRHFQLYCYKILSDQKRQA